jgi:hypothetical protein
MESILKVRDQDLLELIKTLETGHPFWSYRQVRAWLVHRDKIRVNMFSYERGWSAWATS